MRRCEGLVPKGYDRRCLRPGSREVNGRWYCPSHARQASARRDMMTDAPPVLASLVRDLEREIALLRVALRPIAALWHDRLTGFPDDRPIWAHNDAELRVGHVRTAVRLTSGPDLRTGAADDERTLLREAANAALDVIIADHPTFHIPPVDTAEAAAMIATVKLADALRRGEEASRGPKQ